MKLTYKYQDISSFCSPYSYTFQGDDFKTYFYQSPNGDLNLVTEANDYLDKILEIRKDENYQLYMLFDSFYKSLDNYKEKYGYDELFETGIFSWKSDAPANELAVYEPFVYNYLNIVKEKDVYKLVLINKSKNKSFTIEFNTDRSRYGVLVLCVLSFFNSLKDMTYDYHQITIDEYLYQKTLAKK